MKDKNLKRNRKIFNFLLSFCILIFAFCIFAVKAVNAASLYLSPSTGTYEIGKTFSVGVYVSSLDQAMNAASGIVSFPPDKLEVISLSKNGSIFNLWVQEPTFSNSLGTVNFEGLVLNPGFTGSNGKIITINFKAKAVGRAEVSFNNGEVLANDGKGTNILSNLETASFSIQPKETVSSEIKSLSGVPSAPKISSPTHPDENKWYSNNNPKFVWELPSGITGVRLLYDKSPLSTPSIFYPEIISEKQLENIEDGIYYFHVQLRNSIGWGGISHFKFQIDTQPPKPFKIEVKEGRATNNPSPTLVFETTDEMSGIDHYEIIIDNNSPIKTESPEYKLPPQDLGKHTIIVKAVDKAGNETLAMTEIEILPIEAPLITDYPKELLPKSTLVIKGKAIPEATIIVYLQKNIEEIKKGETKADKEGNWSYIEGEPVEKGVYQVWAQTIDSSGAKSRFSEKIKVLVSPPVFIRIGELAISYLTTILTLLGLVFITILIILWMWQEIKIKRKKIQKEVSEAEEFLFKAFKMLKKEVEKEIAKLDGKPDLNKREEKIYNNLKKALEDSEKLIGKEIKDIKKIINK